ncbi:MAG: HAMP domain-containing histidine kinase [Acidobacteriota bacterium]|nr:HAMP domain-containing histidine kinase [Acidobacteriota bacterium]
MVERNPRLIQRLRMRTTLLIPLLLLCFGVTPVSLLILRNIVKQQVSASLASDLQHSVQTYQNLALQRRELLVRESSLLADLPSLKALMTADTRTIADGAVEFWQVSGSDFFALIDRSGKLVVTFNRDQPLDRSAIESRLDIGMLRPDQPVLLALDHRLYEISVQPLVFGDKAHGSQLGYVAIGYAVDERVARQVSEAAAAEVTFAVDGQIVASTLQPALEQQLVTQASGLVRSPTASRNIQLGKADYLAASVPLGAANLQTSGAAMPQLIVLKSFEQATYLVNHVNRWVLTLVLIAMLAGGAMLLSISHNLTGPIQTLVEGTRALALGNFDYKLSEDGVEEIRELSRAFERMRVELQRTQSDLLDSERLATIGRMASSISHDLRHYLSAMYANAEFMSIESLPQTEREELFLEVGTAVQGMTDLLDSLLLFTQTGRALRPEQDSIAGVVQRAVAMVRSHPAARDVRILVDGQSSGEGWMDSTKLGRAVYNLLLNACQAARRGKDCPLVSIHLVEDEHNFRIEVTDNGPGVPSSIRETIFLPFVSEGKESGVGLGLTLAQQIAQEHGGNIELRNSPDGHSIFVVTLHKLALRALGEAADRKNLHVV